MGLTAPPVPPPPEYAKDAKGRFVTGAGNPGRRAGSQNAVSRGAVLRVQGMGEIALDQLLVLVEQGNFAAIKLVLDYVLPRNSRPVELESSDPRAIITAASDGSISPDEAARLAQAFRSAGEAADLQDIKSQLDEFRAFMEAKR